MNDVFALCVFAHEYSTFLDFGLRVDVIEEIPDINFWDIFGVPLIVFPKILGVFFIQIYQEDDDLRWNFCEKES